MAPTTRTRTASGGPGSSTPQTTPRAPGPPTTDPDAVSGTHTRPAPKPHTVQAITISAASSITPRSPLWIYPPTTTSFGALL
ncbi:hypothetical protein A0H81_05641 [Grifola frondosa]|uniref:Uncharacterized protein n=1 Tax=Grifola frondosa TaxID=5627 RepID=A0A1C7MCF4_GRIFR|nr:hypothetical protein A0H81_05641 [Grifola frondosa]